MLSHKENAISPVVLCPADGTIHVLWGTTSSDSNPQPAAIFHVQVSAQGPLTEPVDVIALPADRALDLDVALDSEAIVHLVWSSQGVYYSSAPLSCISSPRCWSEPMQLSQGTAVSPSIRVGPDGVLHVVYVDAYVSPYVQHAASYDGGQTWEHTGPVSRPVGRAYGLNAQLAIGPDGRLHVAWAESVENFPPSGVYYAFSDDGGRSWTEPIAIAEGGYSWPSVFVSSEGRVHYFWTGTGAWAGKYHTWSVDNGITWMPPERAWPRDWPDVAGFLYAPGFVESKGAVHLVSPVGGLPVRTFNTTGIFYAFWMGERWSEPVLLTSETELPYFEFGYSRICTTPFEELVAVWHSLNYHNVPSAADHPNDWYVWYATTSLGERHAELPTVDSLPTAVAVQPAATDIKLGAEAPSSTPIPLPTPSSPAATLVPTSVPVSDSPVAPIGVGSAAALAAVLVAVAIVHRRRRIR